MSAENLNNNWKGLLRSVEEGVQLTSSALLKSTPDKFFEWTDEMPWGWLMDKTKEVMNNGIKSVFKERVTQAESQKVRQIFQILTQISESEPLNTTTIKKRSELSWDSVNRTLKILRQKKIVRVKQHSDRKNNEKFYILNNNKAMEYQKNLILWKSLDNLIKSYKRMDSDTIQHFKIDKRFPEGFNDWIISVTPNISKRIETTLGKMRIGKLPYTIARRLMIDYISGMFCYDCFEKGDVIRLEPTKDNTFLCTNCGKEYPPHDEIPISDARISEWRKYHTEKEIKKILKKY